MSEIDVKENIVISYYDNVNWNEVFNKIESNLKEFDCEEPLKNCVNYLIH